MFDLQSIFNTISILVVSQKSLNVEQCWFAEVPASPTVFNINLTLCECLVFMETRCSHLKPSQILNPKDQFCTPLSLLLLECRPLAVRVSYVALK